MITNMTATFKDQVETLVKTGKADNFTDVANTIGWNKSSLSLVMKGKRNIPPEVYRKFAEVYNIKNPEPKAEPDLKDEMISVLKSNARLLEDSLKANLAELHQQVLMNQALLLMVKDNMTEIMARIKNLPDPAENVLYEVAHKLSKETSEHFESLSQKGK